MKLIDNMVQGSPEWLSFRRTRIMASEASAVLGLNPWCSNLKLWEQKLQLVEPEPENPAMARGSKLEPQARVLFEEITGIEMTPVVCQSDARFWQAASLDGISKCGRYLVEIKCPGQENHRFTCEEKLVKPLYMAQIQHQLEVTKCEKAYFFSYRPESVDRWAMLEVIPDKDFIYQLNALEEEFYRCLCDMKMPPAPWVFEPRRKKEDL